MDTDDLELYEDVLLEDDGDEIIEEIAVPLRELDRFNQDMLGDELAEFAGYPLLMNVRYKSMGFDAESKTVKFEIRGWNPA